MLAAALILLSAGVAPASANNYADAENGRINTQPLYACDVLQASASIQE